MINLKQENLPILIDEEHQVLINQILQNLPKDAAVIHDYTELTAFIQTLEFELEPQLSDPKREPFVVTLVDDFGVEPQEPLVKIQYWLLEIDIHFEQGDWHIQDIRCLQKNYPSIHYHLKQ